MTGENPSNSTRTNTSTEDKSFDGISSISFDKSEANARSDFVKKRAEKEIKMAPQQYDSIW